MKKLILVLALVGAGLLAPACGDDTAGDDTASGFDNVQACKNWLTTISCGQFDFTTLIDCNAYAYTFCDIDDYFDCLSNRFVCDDGNPNPSGWEQCTSLANCN